MNHSQRSSNSLYRHLVDRPLISYQISRPQSTLPKLYFERHYSPNSRKIRKPQTRRLCLPNFPRFYSSDSNRRGQLTKLMETVAALIARHLLSILGLAFVDARAVRIALCAVVIALDVHLYQVLCRSHREDVLGYVVGSWLFAGIIFTTYFLALTPNPRKTFRLRDSVDPQTMSQKLIWSIKVHSSPRLIGFEGQAAKIPRAPAIGRREFVTQQLKNVILETLVTGGLWLPVVWFNLIDFIHPAERRLPSLKQEAIRRLWATALGLYSARWSLNTVYEILSILSVGIGLTQPKEWPPFFGSIFEGTTLAKCWG